MSSITVTPHFNGSAALPMGATVERDAAAQRATTAWQWTLCRNCSLAPCQALCALGFVAAMSLGMAVFFWFFGAPLVMPFALVEVGALGVALLVYARHAADGERVQIDGRRLRLTRERGGRIDRFDFDAGSVRVSLAGGADGLIEIRSGAQCVSVGAFVRPERRARLANELRAALRQAAA
jgi:uncharacterized membrane protein